MHWFKDNRYAAIGLGVLGLVTVILVALALRPVQVPASSGSPYTPPPTNSPTAESTSEEPSETESPSPERTAEETEEPEQPEPVPTGRLITAASADRAWRATVGSCEDGASLETTSNGGESWDTVDPGLTPMVRLKALDEATMFAIGGGDGCDPSFQITSSAGDVWQEIDAELGGSWYVQPADRNTIHGPGGEAAPCEADMVDFAGLSNTVGMVVCTDGDVQGTTDGGDSWSSVGTAGGAVALAPQLDPDSNVQSYLLASLEVDCEGVALRVIGTSAAGVADAPTGCAETGEIAAGEVAVALNGDTAWLWAGDQVLVSTDGAESW